MPGAQLEATDTRVGMIGLGQGALWAACAIAFISWMHRAYSNIQALPPAYPRYATGWTIGAWFVPILNFFRPQEARRSSGPASRTRRRRDRGRSRPSRLPQSSRSARPGRRLRPEGFSRGADPAASRRRTPR